MIKIALAIGGVFIASSIGGYTAIQWYLSSADSRDALTHQWLLDAIGDWR